MFAKKCLVAVFVAALAISPAGAQIRAGSGDWGPPGVQNQLTAFHQAWVTGDADAMRPMLSPAFQAQIPDGYFGTEDWLDRVAGTHEEPNGQMTDPVVTQDGDIAIAKYNLKLTRADGSTANTRHLTVLRQTDDGAWQIVAHSAHPQSEDVTALPASP
jgi:ketosteroid isomerase-like protein